MINIINTAVGDVRIKLLLMIPFLLCATLASAAVADKDLAQRQRLTSHLLINMFLKKVDDDKLILFGKRVSSSDLEPYQVSHVHNLMDDTLLIRLYFKIRKKILIPDYENYYVEGITVETKPDGKLIQIITQVSPFAEGKAD
jgi:hypothetical protein